MSSVTLTQVWIHDGLNLSSYVTAEAEEVQPKLAAGGRFVSLAGGRQRLISTAARGRSLPLTLELLEAADVQLLEAWAGRLLMLRSPHGLLLFGSFLELETAWRSAAEAQEVRLTFTEITSTVEV